MDFNNVVVTLWTHINGFEVAKVVSMAARSDRDSILGKLEANEEIVVMRTPPAVLVRSETRDVRTLAGSPANDKVKSILRVGRPAGNDWALDEHGERMVVLDLDDSRKRAILRTVDVKGQTSQREIVIGTEGISGVEARVRYCESIGSAFVLIHKSVYAVRM